MSVFVYLIQSLCKFYTTGVVDKYALEAVPMVQKECINIYFTDV